MRIVFCLPGKTYSGDFLKSFTDLWTWCLQNGVQPVLSQNYSSMVNFARCQVAGADVNRGPKQKPCNPIHFCLGSCAVCLGSLAGIIRYS